MFARLIPPPAEVKVSNIKSKFTPVHNLFEPYSRIYKYIKLALEWVLKLHMVAQKNTNMAIVANTLNGLILSLITSILQGGAFH